MRATPTARPPHSTATWTTWEGAGGAGAGGGPPGCRRGRWRLGRRSRRRAKKRGRKKGGSLGFRCFQPTNVLSKILLSKLLQFPADSEIYTQYSMLYFAHCKEKTPKLCTTYTVAKPLWKFCVHIEGAGKFGKQP